MLNWKADEQRRQARVAEMVERTLAQPMVQTANKTTNKRGERTTGKVNYNWKNWDVDLQATKPDNVHRVIDYFATPATGKFNVYTDAVAPKKAKATTNKVQTQDNRLAQKAVLTIVDGKRVWTHPARATTESTLTRVQKAIEQIKKTANYRLASYHA